MVSSGGKHRSGGKQKPTFNQPDDSEDELDLPDDEEEVFIFGF